MAAHFIERITARTARYHADHDQRPLGLARMTAYTRTEFRCVDIKGVERA